jgi:hypothetical protein
MTGEARRSQAGFSYEVLDRGLVDRFLGGKSLEALST